jgi:hypothetical protein
MYQETLGFTISGNKDPSAEIANLEQIYNRLQSAGVDIPGLVRAMTLLSSVPSSWNIASSFLAAKSSVNDVTYQNVRAAILTEYNQRRTSQAQANKFSGMRRGNQKPQWKPQGNHQQQQQQRPQGQHQHSPQGQQKQQQQPQGDQPKKKTRRGKRKDNQNANEATTSGVEEYTAQSVTQFASPMPLLHRISSPTRDPRPRPSPYPKPHPIGRFETAKARVWAQKGKEIDEKNAMEVDPIDEAITEHFSTPQDDDDAISLGSTASEYDWYVTSPLRSDTNDAIQSWISNSLYVDRTRFCFNTFFYASPSYQCDKPECNKCGKQPAINTKYPTEWLLDSGASCHFTGVLDDFVEFEMGNFGNVGTAEAGKILPITARGTVMFEHEVVDYRTGEVRILTSTIAPVYYCKGMGGRILSTNTFLQNGVTMTASENSTMLLDPSGSPILSAKRGHGCCSNNLHFVFCRMIKNSGHVNRSVQDPSYEIWHQRFGHASDDALKRVPESSKTPIKIDFPRKKHTCPGCAFGKQHQKTFSENPQRATHFGELIHSDLLEFPIQSYHKHKWAITFLDDYSSAVTIALLRSKSQAFKALKDFVALISTQHDAKVKRFRTDNGGEYVSQEMEDFFKEKGIIHETTAPYAHQQNGRAERLNRTLLDKIRAMMTNACIPESYWEFAIQTAVHVYNRTPMRRIGWKSPFELWYGAKPDVSRLRVFGCGAYVFIPEEKRKNKLEPRSELMLFVGYTSGGANYLFIRHTKNNAEFVSPTAIFEETYFPKCPQTDPRGYPRRAPSVPNDDDDDSRDADPPSAPAPFGFGGDPSKPLPPTPPRARSPSVPSSGPSRPRTPSRPPSPQRDAPPPRDPQPGPSAPRRSGRQRRAPLRPGNVYGDRSDPVADLKGDLEDLLDKIRDVDAYERHPRERDVRRPYPPEGVVIGPQEERFRRTFPYRERRAREYSRRPQWNPGGAEPPVNPEIHPPSEPSEERPPNADMEPPMEDIQRIVHEGGLEFIEFLMANAVAKPKTPVQFKDLGDLSPSDRKAWFNACLEELQALKKRGVYELVDLPKGRRAIKNRWVFNTKSDGRKRARLVAKGFSQIEGVDFDELFSPVVRYETARLLLGVAALEDWEIESVDVKTAYLYGKLDEEIYMEQPEGFRLKGKENKVWRLHRALYGLKQAGLAWWRELTTSMKELGFKRCESDAGVYYYRCPKTAQIIIALVYVDDVAIIGKRTSLFTSLKARFMKKWECRDLGECKEFLGMCISRDRKNRKIYLDQVGYLDKVLEKFNVAEKPTKTPLASGFSFLPNSKPVDPAFRQKYQQLVGSLMYLMIGSRPDIAYAVVKLSQQCANPAPVHYEAGLHVLRYLLATRKYRMVFDGLSNEAIVAYSDSDWAQDSTDRKSVTGNYVTLASGCVSWLSRRQKTVAASSTEAEYMALSDCSKQLVWMHQLLLEIGLGCPTPHLIGDNQGSIFWASNPVQEKRSKHIDVKYHIIRQYVEDKKIDLFWVDGTKNPADIFTKNLDKTKFERIRSLLGMEFFAQ